MPLVSASTYRPPLLFRSAHIQTIYPSLFRKVPVVTNTRERIETPDDDFLDLDWNQNQSSNRLVIFSHGLEGSSKQSYVQGMARVFSEAGWTVLAWNYRGCSGEVNRQMKSYHSGATEELQLILDHVFTNQLITEIALVGFSLGGNMTLKYLGDCAHGVDTRIKCAVALSVPCDLASSSLKLEEFQNRLYMIRFLRTLRKKIRHKMGIFPGQLEDHGLDTMKTFHEFDGSYTAPLHGFKDAEDYWTQCSSKPALPNIAIPSLLINAANDPFLAPECYPIKEAKQSDHFHLEMPYHGGHMGFPTFGQNNTYWSEHRALEFVEQHIPS